MRERERERERETKTKTETETGFKVSICEWFHFNFQTSLRCLVFVLGFLRFL